MQDFIESIQQFGPLKYIQEWLMPYVQEITQFTAQIPLIWQVVAVGVWSMIPFIESDVGVAIGIGVGVPVVPATIAAIIGNWIAVFGIITLTHKARAKVAKSGEKTYSKRRQKVMKAVERYGVPGASMLGPLLIGTHLNSFFMVAAGLDRRYVLLWQTVAIVVWSIIFAIIFYGIKVSLGG